MLDINEINNHIMIDWKMSVDVGVIALTKGHNRIEYNHSGDGIDYIYTYSGAVKDVKSKVNVLLSDIAEIINYGDTMHDNIVHSGQTKNYSLRGYTVSEFGNKLVVKSVDGNTVCEPQSVDEAIEFIRHIT